MKRNINEIRDKITNVAESKRQDAAFVGEMGDGGASALENELVMWISGLEAAHIALNKSIDSRVLLDVPSAWQKYFLIEDPEYQEYQRLKKKFDHR